MPTPPRLRRQHAGAAAVVLALHVAGVALMLRLGAWPDRTPATADVPAFWLRLLPAPATQAPARPDDAAASPAPSPDPPAAPPRRLPARPPSRPGDDTLQAITLPASADPSAAAAAEAVAPPASAASVAPPPRNLALPRDRAAPWRQRNPALDDPRANTPRLTLEQRIADAMGGDGDWVEEPIDADHRRLRRGHTCIYLQRPRAAQLDPFHPANRALPWQAGTPVRC